MKRDKLFLFVIGAALFIIIGFGIATLILSLVDPTKPDKDTTARVVSAFQGMFGTVIAFAVGYLVGHGNGNGGGK